MLALLGISRRAERRHGRIVTTLSAPDDTKPIVGR
jgi:hypothetical protein